VKTLNNNFLRALLLIVCGFISTYTYAQQDNADLGIKAANNDAATCTGSFCGCAGNSQAPLGVMTDHIHSKGSFMLSYTFMNTMMQGNNIGASKVSDNDVYKNYMMAPETMTMQMHMLMAMYGVTDRLTVMAMGGYMVNNMNMAMDSKGGYMFMNGSWMYMPAGTSMGMQTMSSGLTDTKLSALYNFSNKPAQRIIASLGINLPTGTIMATGTTVLGDNQRLAYDMQTGTGSYGLAPDFTYARKNGLFYWGGNVGANVNLNYNSLGYKYGNTYHATAWAGYQFLPFVSATLRAEDVHQDIISGADKALTNSVYETTDPTTQTANYGGTWMNMYVGLNFYMMKPLIERFRLMTEYGMPVYQNLNGTQMALKSNFLVGLQYSL
jgi:hypothetical protein